MEGSLLYDTLYDCFTYFTCTLPVNINVCLSFQNLVQVNKLAEKASEPTFIRTESNIYIMAAKGKVWDLKTTDWTQAIIGWMGVLFTFWLEAPPCLETLKLVYLNVVMGRAAEDCTPGQRKTLEGFQNFCQ